MNRWGISEERNYKKESKGNAKKYNIRDMNNFFDIFVNELPTGKKKINKLENRLVDTTQSETQRNKNYGQKDVLRTVKQHHMVNILEFQKE